MKKLLTVILSLVFVVTLSACKPSIEDDILFELIQGDSIYFEVGDNFYDPGVIVKLDGEDLSEYMQAEGQVDPNVAGEYIITYTLTYEDVVIVKTRLVTIGNFSFDCESVEELIVEEPTPASNEEICEAYEAPSGQTLAADLYRCVNTWTSYLNTTVRLTMYIEKDSAVNAVDAYYEIEKLLATYTMVADKYKEYGNVSSVCSVNKNNGSSTVVSEELFDLIDFTLTTQAPLEDYYDATMGTLLGVWHTYRDDCNNTGDCKLPAETHLELANTYTGSDKVTLNSETNTVDLELNTTLDLGGVSKGYVSREITEYLDSLGIFGYIVNNGESNISVGGTHPYRDAGKFIIGIKKPTYSFFVSDLYAAIYLEDGEQLVTSGDYQKYFMVDEEYYHHIISPETLMPESNSRSVSIITTDPALADLYSTAIFNMSIEEGQEFVNSIDGLEAIWYGTDDQVYFSQNFEEKYLVQLYE